MNKEFFEALAMLEKEKGIPMQYLIEKIEAAISIAIKRDENGAEDNVVEINPETGRFYVAVRKTVVEEIEDPANEILKAEAAKYNKTAAVGDIIEISFGNRQVKVEVLDLQETTKKEEAKELFRYI